MAVDNRITLENSRTDGVMDKSYWDAASSNLIEGFTTDFSVNAGSTVDFKININPNVAGNVGDDYKVEIFRLGYYGGAGAREVASFTNTHGTVQPDAQFNPDLGLVDAGNWTVTDHWQIPADAVSGVYLARVQRLDANGNPIEGATNQIPFIVRNDGVHADIVLQTSDTTWEAYNGWGGNNGQIGPNFYGDPTNMVDNPAPPEPGLNTDRAYAVSYNRPFLTRDGGGAASGAQDYLFGADYAAIYWLEKNGYDVSYISGVDTARLGVSYLQNYEAYISVGHDEYWSGDQRANVEAARDAGVNLLFWSGNEVYWKTRWTTDLNGDDYRTLVSYKETWANGDPSAGPADYANLDPSNEWTGTWRDMRFVGNPSAIGQEPENSLTGQLFRADGDGEAGALDVPQEDAALRYWRDTSVQANGGATDLANGLIGYEWDSVAIDQYRPAGEITLSQSTMPWREILMDQGNTTTAGTATHSLSLYRAESGALVFDAGTVFWSWGLSNEHDSSPYGAEIENTALQQFNVNLLADMGIQPGSLQADLTPATASTDHTPATATVNDIGDVAALSTVTISGTATDNDNNASTDDGVVALVELSFDRGAHWTPANGTTNWSYSWHPTAPGNYTVEVRAIDDSLNVYNAPIQQQAVTVTSAVAPDTYSLFDLQPPSTTLGTFSDGQPVELGMRFTVAEAGEITQLRYFRTDADSDDTDVRQGQLWRVSDGALLGTATFTSGLGESGWQVTSLSSPVAVQPGEEYVVSYLTNDNYTAQNGFFAPSNEVTFDGVDDNAFTGLFGMVSAPEDDPGHANGVYHYGATPTLPTDTYGSSSYLVDVTFRPDGSTPANESPVITSGNFSAAENQTVAGTVQATDADNNSITYGIAGGADGGLFNINATTGALTFKAAPDFENPADSGHDNVYDVVVSASDAIAAPVTKAITVTVTNVDETSSNSPPQITSSSSFTAPENQVLIGSVTATDPDANTLTYAIAGGADANLFTINASTGLLQFKSPQDFETQSSFSLTISASDGTNAPVTQDVTVNVSDVDETANGPASLTGHLLKADYIFGDSPGSVWGGPGGEQTQTVGNGVEFPNLPYADSSVGNGSYGLASVDAGAQTIRIEFPLDPNVFSSSSFVRFAGPQDGRTYNGVLLTDADLSLNAIQSVRIVGQQGFTTQTGQLISLDSSNLTVTADGIFLNVSNLGRLVDVDPDQLGAQAAWVELIVELDDAPAVSTASLNVSEGGTTVLSASDFVVTDPDSTDFTFSLSDVTHGTFQTKNSEQWTDTSTFTSAQLAAGEVRFVHNGDQAAPTFTVVASDGSLSSTAVNGTVDYTAVDNSPAMTAASFAVTEGGTTILSTTDFSVSDADSTAFTFTVSNVSHGSFETSTNGQWSTALTFTSAQLAAGEVRFVHDGGEDQPAFSVTASDGSGTSNTISGEVSFTNVNDAPVVTAAHLAVLEGGTVVLAPADFTVSDPDSSAFTFHVSEVTNGVFQTLTGTLWADATEFSADDLAAGHVRFVHDGSEAAPTFNVGADDGTDEGASVAASIDYSGTNDAPVLSSASLTIAEGGTALLSASNFAISDADSTTFVFSVSNVTNGVFQTDSGSAWSDASTFTSAQLAAGQVRFVHSGGENAPSFDVTASDGSLSSETVSAGVSFTNVNDAPVITSAGIALSEGGTVVLSSTDLVVSDPDSSGFTFTVSNVTHGHFELNTSGTIATVTSFTSAQLAAGQVQFVHDGGEAAPTFSVAASDGGASSSTVAAVVNFSNVNDAPTLASAVSDQSATSGTAFTFQVPTGTFQDSDGDTLAYTAKQSDGSDLPTWLAFDASTRTFSGTPAVADVGSVDVILSASDGQASVSDEFIISVAKGNSAPTAISLTGNTVAENSSGAVIGTLATTDPDSGETFTYAVSDSRFEVVVDSSGVSSLKLKANQALDYETAKSVALAVTSTDHGGLSVQQQFTVNVTNVVENQTVTMTSSSFTAPSEDNWTVTGTTAADTIMTSIGNDTVRGQAGDDTISTGAGNDAFLYAGGSNGFDTLNGGDGVDTIRATANNTVIGLRSFAGVEAISTGGFTNVSIAGSSSADTLDLSSLTVTGTLTKIDGGAGNDVIIGIAAADTIVGGGGNDTLKSGDGNDTFQVGVSDGVDSFDGGLGLDAIVATAKNVVIGISGLTGLETISSGGFTGVSIAGTTGADTLDFTGITLSGITRIDSGAGNDVVVGSSVADTIAGGTGDDTLSGGADNDTFQIDANAGFDSFDGGDGSDTIVATGRNAIIGINSMASVEKISSGGFSGVQIVGTAGANTLNFGGVLLEGISLIDGAAGDDTIVGSSGNDRISGGAGSDTLSGGDGLDTFVYSNVSESSSARPDSIVNFVHGVDKIDLSAIDAIKSTGKNDAFAFLGDETSAASFHSKAGQLWTIVDTTGVTHLYGDVDGGGADFSITLGVLTSQPPLTSSDIVL